MSDPVYHIFCEEAREHLSALEQGFLDLEAAETVEARRPLIDGLFRHAHSLKGDARAIGLSELQQAAQALEDVLDGLRENPETLSRSIIDDGLSRLDQVRQGFESWQQSSEAGRSDAKEAREDETAPAEAAPAETAESGPASSGWGTDLKGWSAAGRSPVSAGDTPAGSHRPLAEAAPPVASEERFTVRVPSERLDRLLHLVGEMQIAQRAEETIAGRLNELSEQVMKLPVSELEWPMESPRQLRAALGSWQSGIVDTVQRIRSDLRKQHSREELLAESLENDIRGARLLPLAMLTDSLRRTVRDLAQSLEKQVRYEADVGDVMLDKATIEALRDPLSHLLRNAVDHGLEAPADRRAAGKSEEGAIRIRASYDGGMVRMTVSDDGRGIDYALIRERLRTGGQIDETALQALSEKELGTWLFRPGFTTTSAGEVSGRGVGLDVVADSVRRLQGRIELESSSRAGTTFAITVPVTVSLIRILTVLTGGQFYGIPSTSVIRTGQAGREDLRELEGGLVLPLDGEPVPWLPLADWLGETPARHGPDDRRRPYVIVAHHDRRIAVAVDDLEDEREVLLQPLGFPLHRLPGIAGGTIRPDGSVQIVLDPGSPSFRTVSGRPAAAPAEQQPAGRILVVDDSPTTRAILRNVFTAAGYMVRTASDGMDALQRLRMQTADLIVTDIEMPRLNGFDLTRRVKSQYGLPVVLVTGREREDQRREGLGAGADAYVVKSTFQGDSLLDVVRQCLGTRRKQPS